MAEKVIRDYAQARGFHRQTLDRWLAWDPVDRDALEEIAVSLKVSENHLRDMMDWLEEISLRAGAKAGEILTRPAISSITTDPRLGRADKVKRVKDQLRRWRFPRLAALEESIRSKIQAQKLPAGIQLTVPPGLEGGRVYVTLSATSQSELAALAQRLSAAASSAIIAEIFQSLSGETDESEPSSA